MTIVRRPGKQLVLADAFSSPDDLQWTELGVMMKGGGSSVCCKEAFSVRRILYLTLPYAY